MLISDLINAVQEEGKLRFLRTGAWRSQAQQTELVATVNGRENTLAVLEIVEADQ